MASTDKTSQEIGDESFMSASDLRAYMADMELARMAKSGDGMNHAEEARDELIKKLAEPMDLTPQRMKEIIGALQAKLRRAAEDGLTELMVMRFPNALCTDKGRAINNSEEGWPETLTGRPRQAYQIWSEHLRPQGFRLTSMIIEWPGGLPGDVGLFLQWGNAKRAG